MKVSMTPMARNASHMMSYPSHSGWQASSPIFNTNINQPPAVAWGETSPLFTEPYDITLCTCDITNVFYQDYSDNSDNYYVYLHKNIHQKPPGFYFFKEMLLHRSYGLT